MSLSIGNIVGVLARIGEAERLLSKRPTFVGGAGTRLWKRAHRGVRPPAVRLPAVQTRQVVRALLRAKLYREVSDGRPSTPRRERRQLARALASQAFKVWREGADDVLKK